MRLIRFYSKASNTVKRLKGLYSSLTINVAILRCPSLNRDLGFHTVSISVSQKKC